MSLRFVRSAILVSLVAAIQSLGLPAVDAGKPLSWPASLLGHGNLTVNMTAIANDANSTALLNVITSYHLPDTFTLSKQADSVCDGRVDFDGITSAVEGDLCLGLDTNYSDAVDAFKSYKTTDVIAASVELDTCGCFCSCSIACMALLLLAPLCWAGCAACPADSG